MLLPGTFDEPERRRVMAGKRALIDTGTDKRFVRRNKKGQFK
jgi:hypothetical protein